MGEQNGGSLREGTQRYLERVMRIYKLFFIFLRFQVGRGREEIGGKVETIKRSSL